MKKLLLFSFITFFVFGGKSLLQAAGSFTDYHSGRKKSQEMICFERAQRMAWFGKQDLEDLYDDDPKKGFYCAAHTVRKLKKWRIEYDQVSFWLAAKVIHDLLLQRMNDVQTMDDPSNERLVKEYIEIIWELNLMLTERDSELENMLSQHKATFYHELRRRYTATIKTIGVVESFSRIFAFDE